jgi:hypothetical protein
MRVLVSISPLLPSKVVIATLHRKGEAPGLDAAFPGNHPDFFEKAMVVERVPRMVDDDAAMTEPLEQRAHPRTGFGLKVSLMLLREKEPIPGTLENISEGGCYFHTRAVVKEGAAVSVVFGLRPQGLCAASGRVVRVEVPEGFGVRFTDINTYMKEFVSTLACTEEDSRGEVAAGIVEPEIHII